MNRINKTSFYSTCMSFSEEENLSVVSMATGTKCIGESQMSKTGECVWKYFEIETSLLF